MRPALGPGDFTARRGPPLSVARPSPGAGCDPAPTPSQHAQASWSGGAPRPRPGKSGGRPEGLPAAGGSPERAPPCRGAVGVGVRPVATRSTSMCGVHEVICKRAAAPGCILWFPHLRTEAPNRCTFCSETRRRGPGRARLAPGPTRPAVTQPYAFNSGWGQGCQVPRTLDRAENLNAKCVRQASRDQSRNQCSMACEIISCLLAGKPFCRVLSFRILSPTGNLNSGLTVRSACHWFAPRLRHRRPHPCAPALRRG